MKTEWNTLLEDIILPHTSAMRAISAPLREHFHIESFSYQRATHEGDFITYMSRRDWAEEFVQNELYRDDPYLLNPHSLHAGYLWPHAEPNPAYRPIHDAYKANCYLDSLVTWVRKVDGVTEIYNFGASSKRTHLQKLVVSRPKLLPLFTEHFRKKMGGLIDAHMRHPADLHQLTAGKYRKERVQELPSCAQFFHDIGEGQWVEMAQKISPRERVALQLLTRGFSYGEIGRQMGAISERTVESHLNNVKNKLFVYTRAELISIGVKFLELGLL